MKPEPLLRTNWPPGVERESQRLRESREKRTTSRNGGHDHNNETGFQVKVLFFAFAGDPWQKLI